jgi:hypothetical protein
LKYLMARKASHSSDPGTPSWKPVCRAFLPLSVSFIKSIGFVNPSPSRRIWPTDLGRITCQQRAFFTQVTAAGTVLIFPAASYVAGSTGAYIRPMFLERSLLGAHVARIVESGVILFCPQRRNGIRMNHAPGWKYGGANRNQHENGGHGDERCRIERAGVVEQSRQDSRRGER